MKDVNETRLSANAFSKATGNALHAPYFSIYNTLFNTSLLGVHRNQYFKIRPEPDLTGTGKEIRPELSAGTGT